MRERAFLPFARSICGVPVLPLTLRHLTILHAIASPLVVGGEGDLGACAQLLWFISPENLLPSPWVSAREVRAVRKAWTARIWPKLTRRGRTLGALIKAIGQHVSEAMFDVSRPRGRRDSTPASTHFCAAVIDEFAAAYGWPVQTLDARGQPVHMGGILDTPFAQLVQIRRCRTLRTVPGASLTNPRQDELIRKAALAEADALKAAKKEAK